jgi:hypothetical protein
MSVLILRKSVDNERVGGPFFCAGRNEIARIIGRLTLEEQLANLVRANEVIRVTDYGRASLYRDGALVGYIVVLSTV